MNIRSHAPAILTAGAYGMRWACVGSGCTSSSLWDLSTAVMTALPCSSSSYPGCECLAPMITGTGEIVRGQPFDGLGGAEEVGIASAPHPVAKFGERLRHRRREARLDQEIAALAVAPARRLHRC